MAMERKGFSLVEAMVPCPTAYGRKNKMKTPVQMMEHLKQTSIPIGRAAEMDDVSDEITFTGVIADREKPEYGTEYRRLIDRLGGKKVL